MQLSEHSIRILKNTRHSSVFSVSVENNTIDIIESTDSYKGSLLFYEENKLHALEAISSNTDQLDWVFFVNGDLELEVLAFPDLKKNEIDRIFKNIFLSEGFEKREEQLKIAHLIYDWLEKEKIGLIEAPTGIGKSLSYLVPSIVYAKKYNKRVIVSTNTINLQHQLIKKDIPFLKNFIDFNAEIVLGRNNYICRRKVEQNLSKGNVFLFENDLYKDLKDFLANAKEGTKAEFFSKRRDVGEDFWHLIESSSISCAHKKCPHYKSDCFFYKARAKLDKSQIIVANHHLVLSHSIMENAEILPEFDGVIFDEAHNIEKNATNYYTLTASSNEIFNLLNMLYSVKKTESGLLLDADSAIKEKTEEVKQNLKNLFERITLNIKEQELTITSNNINKFKDFIISITDTLDKYLIKLKTYISSLNEEKAVDVKATFSNLYELNKIIHQFLDGNFETNIFWIKRFKQSIHFNITPLTIKDALKSYIYDKIPSVIFISATLTVNDSFDFFKQTVGVDDAEGFIANPNFDYKNNSRLFFIEDIDNPDSKKFPQQISNVLIDIGKSLKGNRGALVLFTSYNMLNTAFELSKDLENLGFLLLKQGELDNFELLRRFKKGRAFLFATSSFWEGIDVKGDKLSVVVITKLPFEVPTTPIEKAKYDLLKKEGKNAFLEYSLPKAILRFKQGIGRLIRDKNDKGVMVVLDNRIAKKSYGKMFLDSVNYINQRKVKKNEIQMAISDFFDSFD